MKRNFTEIGLVGNGKKRNLKFENRICLFLKRKNSGPIHVCQLYTFMSFASFATAPQVHLQ